MKINSFDFFYPFHVFNFKLVMISKTSIFYTSKVLSQWCTLGWKHPVGTRRQNNVVTMLFQRRSNVVRGLGKVLQIQGQTGIQLEM